MKVLIISILLLVLTAVQLSAQPNGGGNCGSPPCGKGPDGNGPPGNPTNPSVPIDDHIGWMLVLGAAYAYYQLRYRETT